jgi:hypothetical protein
MMISKTLPFIKPGTFLIILVILKFICTLFAIYGFQRFSPLVDANLYLSGFYLGENTFRTQIIQSIVLFLLNFGNSIFVNLIFGILSLSGFFYYFLRGGSHWIICLPLFLPSAIIWTSIIGKEAIFYGLFTLALFVWARLIAGKQDIFDLIFLGISLIFIFVLRPHYALVIFWLFISFFLIEKTRKIGLFLLILLAVILFILVDSLFWNELLLRGYGAIDPSARASRFEFFGINYAAADGLERYKALVPLGALLGIIGPMPSEVFIRPLFFPFLIEGILILLFPALIYFFAIKKSSCDKRRFKKLFWVCLVPAILAAIVIHSPFGLLNPGSAIRWRVNFETLFLIAPTLLFFAEFDKNENNSLSP